ncbi:hypothetical protein AAZX31_01G080500 [Glycine max]|uniref:Malectin-like domain-containing protein n=2 Tax=Glycine subgen. Soja TaxID=1462606 RepID=K7K2R7_SOYBN|nr:receptor-like protein 4 [Glycine max]XP_028234152.1 receptor-like protein 4 [Glycine soja]KAG5059976.1 hypothetical protein JHK87_001005 [Glycine soja]KAG5088380.1 hypothetical protein JHK86_000992 [Glycine max]KAH1162256.1 hypothetical protein GYH30_000942 [Glycine max]KAH1265428.1 Receptor-like protein 4 [Glycine max]KRH75486.1 hypothetical protein GLYMA_01G087700v4 [Glycine max]|eukprot:XP_003518009.1 receptor-like protein 4 [Glycine max]
MSLFHTLTLLIFLFVILFTTSTTTSTPLPLPTPSFPSGLSYHIDCGSPTNSTDQFNTTWLSDRYFSGGATGIVSEPLRFRHGHEKTLRFFPISSGKKNCYTVPNLPPSRYLLRTFVVYDNYDGRSHPPSFDVAVAATVVFSWRSPWPQSLARNGAYADLFATIASSEALICFYSFATDPPVVSSIELFAADPASYDAAAIGKNDIVLVNYGRLSCGSNQWGPGFSNDSDRFGRSWQSDSDFRTGRSKVRAVSTRSGISGTEQKPNYFPEKLYQSAAMTAVTAEEGDGVLEYELSVDAKLDYLVWLHFAEIEGRVRRVGERVFDVYINNDNLTRIDIYKQVGGFAAFTWHHTVKNLSSSVLSVKLVGVVGAPLICGIENYALVPSDPSTVPEQVVAMKALKDSFRVPERMGWNGDPCAPTNWDAWEGVTCRTSKNSTTLVISQIDLGSQGLKGSISDQISLLSDLVSLNLSSNLLVGEIPSGLGQKSLIHLDLSNNQLTGPIPDSIASSSLQLVLLNGNLLEGRVPEQLYSIGVHGGAIDLSGNKGLCGVPSLPDCPMFWENGKLSTQGKIAIGLSCLFVFCVILLLVYIYIRRRRNDYDFALPHELTSLAAKRNRYQRQKSLMVLEMESQHAKGLPSHFTTQ